MTPADKGKKIVLWLGFSVIFALGPLFINFLSVRGQPNFEMTRLYDHGELFLISTVLCADAVGRLFNHRGSPSFFTIICMMAAVYLLFTSTVEYGMVAEKVYKGESISRTVGGDSWKQFFATVLAGLGAVFTEE